MDIMSLMCNSTTADPKRLWCIKSAQLNHMVMCYKQSFTRTEGLWRAENATSYSVPTFLIQLIIIIILNRLLMIAFRYLRLPRIAAEILGGALLGPTGLADTMLGKEYVFPFRSVMTLETVANLGLLYYMFLVGLEVDIKPIVQAPKKAFIVAVAGFLVPFPVGYFLHYFMVENFETVTQNLPTRHGPLFWGLALCTTNFPDLAQILSDLKLLRSEVGRTALSAAVITDFISWLLLVVGMAMVNNSQIYTIIFGAGFVAFSLLILQPALAWTIRRTYRAVEASGGYNDYHVSLVLTLVVACGYATDACGCHSIFGAFMLGLIIPKGELKDKLKDKIDDFISCLMMPLFFVIVGLRINLYSLIGMLSVGTIAIVFSIVFVVKIVTTFVTAVFFNKMRFRDGLALGVLMNTKGLLTLIVISSARDMKVLNNQTFALLIVPIWLMTALVGPTLKISYRSGWPGGGEKDQSTIAGLEPHSEFRILTCLHSTREISSVVSLLEAANPTRNSPVSITVVQLVENVGRASAMRIVQDACRIDGSAADEVTAGFGSLKSPTVSVETVTAVSSYATMHVDVCSLARENHTALILLTFHLRPGGNADEGAAAAAASAANPLRVLNQNVMEHAECSVGVLVDRGHRPPLTTARRGRSFLMLFVGGPDDREALSYVERMAGSPRVRLTVARFVPGKGIDTAEEGKEKKLDSQSVEEFRKRTKGNGFVSVTENSVEDEDEIVKMINTMEEEEYDLVVVGKGRRRGRKASDWSEFPELGSLGDSLACSTFAAGAWILVIQQGGRVGKRFDDEGDGKLEERLGHTTWQPRELHKPDLTPFVWRGQRGY